MSDGEFIFLNIVLYLILFTFLCVWVPNTGGVAYPVAKEHWGGAYPVAKEHWGWGISCS